MTSEGAQLCVPFCPKMLRELANSRKVSEQTVNILCPTEKPGTHVKYEVGSIDSSSGDQIISLPLTPPFFLDEEATAPRLVFTAHSLTPLNYATCFCRTMGLMTNGQGWQECQGTPGKGFGVWKPAPRPSETKQHYPSLTLLASLSAKCLSPSPDKNQGSGKSFPLVFVPCSSVDRKFKTNGHFGGFEKQWNFMPLMNGQLELGLAALNGCT